MDPIRKQARYAGLLYLMLLILGPISLIYVPGRLFVPGDATATADRIRASGSLLRIGVASDLAGHVILIFLVLALYRLFKPVNDSYARQLVILGALVSVPIMFINVLFELAALTLVSGERFLAVFGRDQLDALAYLFVRMHSQGITVVSIFWGLWLFPFGILVIRSGFIPRVLGVLLMIAGVSYLANAFTYLLLPDQVDVVGRIARPLRMGEMPIIFWLLIWGARPGPAAAPGTTAVEGGALRP